MPSGFDKPPERRSGYQGMIGRQTAEGSRQLFESATSSLGVGGLTMSKSSVPADDIEQVYKPQAVCAAEHCSTYLRHKKGGPNGGLKIL